MLSWAWHSAVNSGLKDILSSQGKNTVQQVQQNLRSERDADLSLLSRQSGRIPWGTALQQTNNYQALQSYVKICKVSCQEILKIYQRFFIPKKGDVNP
jgi:hypothetical protein